MEWFIAAIVVMCLFWLARSRHQNRIDAASEAVASQEREKETAAKAAAEEDALAVSLAAARDAFEREKSTLEPRIVGGGSILAAERPQGRVLVVLADGGRMWAEGDDALCDGDAVRLAVTSRPPHIRRGMGFDEPGPREVVPGTLVLRAELSPKQTTG